MNWGPEDFLAAGLILGLAACAFWLAMRQSVRLAYRMAFALGLGAVVMLIWVALAVGIIGEPGHPANLAFAVVVAVAAAGFLLSRLDPGRLSRAMAAAAAAQAIAGAAAVVLTARDPAANGLLAVAGFNLVVCLAFAISAWLFRIDDGMRRAESRWFDGGVDAD